MKTLQDSLAATEPRTNKSTVFFTALTFAALMVSAVGGGAAFMIYREFSAMPAVPATAAKSVGGLPASQWENTLPATRPVVAESSARSDYHFVDNTVLPPAEARRVIAAWRSNPVYVANVPPPALEAPGDKSLDAGSRPPLADPESHYIVSNSTGRIVGIDGSAGAVTDARRQQAIPVAVAVQTPPPEVRVAAPVQVRPALPVDATAASTDDPQYAATTDGTQYVPTRRAQPVATGRSFDAASYLSRQDNIPVLRAQSANTEPRSGAGYHLNF